jgi:tRNA threonylcarbamoyladenosine biosynthesis protein TsaE
MSNLVKVISTNPEDTLVLGSLFSQLLLPGDKIALHGELGAGKTLFVKGLAKGLTFDGIVSSPTFTLVHKYFSNPVIYHLDCFRLRSPKDVQSLGLDDYLSRDSILVVEWADLISGYMDHWNWIIRFESDPEDDQRRNIVFQSAGEDISQNSITQLKSMLSNRFNFTL